MPTALNAALGALSPERSGSGSALITALRQVGATIGVAVLGTVLDSVYRSGLSVAGLPGLGRGGRASSSVAGGVAVAHAIGSASLLHAVGVSYVHGMDVMLWVCAAIAAASALLGLAFLPRWAPAAACGRGRRRRGCGAARARLRPGGDRPRRCAGCAPQGGAGQNDAMSELADAVQPMGLRERKKAKTRAAIRQHALRLFREQGYSATTVEQIAAAAEVSPATFFRYYPTKEDVVLQDDMDVVTLAALEAQPAGLGPIAAMRAATGRCSTGRSPRSWPGCGDRRADHVGSRSAGTGSR